MKVDKNLEMLKEILCEIESMSNDEFIADYKRLEKKVEGRVGRIVLKEDIYKIITKKESYRIIKENYINYVVRGIYITKENYISNCTIENIPKHHSLEELSSLNNEKDKKNDDDIFALAV